MEDCNKFSKNSFEKEEEGETCAYEQINIIDGMELFFIDYVLCVNPSRLAPADKL
jgi:hypothetical protein